MTDIIVKSKCDDECYTTLNESQKLADYLVNHNIIQNKKIWLPFDTRQSNIYKSLLNRGCDVILSNLENGQDFYVYEPPEWHIIISNPPFSNRTALFQRLLSFNKPFIILQPTYFFNNQNCIYYLSQHSQDFQFLLPRSSMSFLSYKPQTNKIQNTKHGASFYSFWLFYKIGLQFTFNHLPDSNGERVIESYVKDGNFILENQINIFTFMEEE